VSRAALARRFTDLVGEPPMTYLTSWRLSMAADLLAGDGAQRSSTRGSNGDVTLESVAQQVGYSSAFALSAAFKRVRGISPRDHRRSLAG
jgi:AraC-like DNA-binding protein